LSLYRQTGGPTPRALALALIAALLVGGLIGFLLGRGSAEEPTLVEQATEARQQLGPVAAGLELVPIEYQNVVRAGRVTAPTEYAATRQAVQSATSDLAAASEELRVIDPRGYAAAAAAVQVLRAAVGRRAAASRVEGLADAARARIEAIAAPGAAQGRP
jgi:hypothetical protein